jgi:hypothetical protein
LTDRQFEEENRNADEKKHEEKNDDESAAAIRKDQVRESPDLKKAFL